MSSSSALAEASQPAEHKTSHKDVAFPSNQAAIPSTRDGMVFSSGANIEQSNSGLDPFSASPDIPLSAPSIPIRGIVGKRHTADRIHQNQMDGVLSGSLAK